MADYSSFFEKHSVELDHLGFPGAVTELRQLLDARVVYEEKLQNHLTRHPYILSEQFGHCHHVFPKVDLGGRYEADYFCLDIPSTGKEWFGIEIENPMLQVVTKAGHKSAKLENALQQVRDWRTWVRENLSTARGAPQNGGIGLEDINPDFFGWVIIGRRSSFTDEFNEIRRQVERDERIKIRSWDGIVEWADTRAAHWLAWAKSLSSQAERTTN